MTIDESVYRHTLLSIWMCLNPSNPIPLLVSIRISSKQFCRWDIVEFCAKWFELLAIPFRASSSSLIHQEHRVCIEPFANVQKQIQVNLCCLAQCKTKAQLFQRRHNKSTSGTKITLSSAKGSYTPICPHIGVIRSPKNWHIPSWRN